MSAAKEIERLKVQHEEMLLKHANEQQAALSTLDGAMKEIKRLKAENYELKQEVSRLNRQCASWITENKPLQDEIDRMTEQAIQFRDMAQKQGFLLSRAADALQSFLDCDLREVVAYDLIKELRDHA